MNYYGWRIAWSLAVTQTVGFGVLFYGFAVFTLPMEQELGWTRAETSGAYSLALLLSGLLAVPVGRWVDRRGARVPMTVGSAAGVALVLAWSFVTTLPALYLVQFGIGVVMAMVLYDVAFTVIASWFRRDRVRAMLVVTSVAGLASTIFIPLATALVEGWGWRTALRVLALLLAGLTIPLHGLVLRDHPRRLGLEPDGVDRAEATPEASLSVRQALRSVTFWRLSMAFGLDRVVMVAIAAHAVPLLIERGHGPGLVASVTGSIGLMQVAGRLLFAPAARFLTLAQLATLTFVVRAAALGLLLSLTGAHGPWLFAVLFGLANGATTLARAGLVGEAFGSANYGAINGGMSTLIALGQTAAPLAVGAVRVATGGYDPALWLLVLVTVVAMLAAAGIRTDMSASRTTS